MNIKKRLLVASFLFSVLVLGLFFLYSFQIFAGNGEKFVEVEIKQGETFDLINKKLKEKGLVRFKTIFKIYNILTGKSHQIKPGKYVLALNISISELTTRLVEGPPEISIIIAPGMTIREIDEKFSSLGIISGGDLINYNISSLKENYIWLEDAKSLEGFLLPDTYNFFVGSGADLVIKKILNDFETKVLPFLKSDANLLEIINLASLLEKEIPDYSERRLVAGLLIKRMSAGMPLQVDATLIYNKCFGKFLKCPALEEKDFKIDSLYNTYLYLGLPETPICNPSFEAIKAALNPEKSDYWYYLSDPKTQKTIFSKTLDEHNKNRAIYLLK
ncbi:endolytic transglycosylase MltG [Candidatus Wolfebacteria bacterium]|nr:endolytic transglycosylase MltG [Candidatus Wolfebacteria bacterium]